MSFSEPDHELRAAVGLEMKAYMKILKAGKLLTESTQKCLHTLVNSIYDQSWPDYYSCTPTLKTSPRGKLQTALCSLLIS